MNPIEYRCTVCNEIFEYVKEWKEKAYEEAKKLFGHTPNDKPMDIVCDDCWKDLQVKGIIPK